jgi:hypothetical protein
MCVCVCVSALTHLTFIVHHRKQVELVPGGAEKKVTRENHKEWVRLTEARRLCESDSQVGVCVQICIVRM